MIGGRMSLIRVWGVLVALGFVAVAAPTSWGRDAVALPDRTALDDYMAKPDPSYQWKVVDTKSGEKGSYQIVEFTSQTWRTAEEVDRTQWTHTLVITYPKKVRFDTALLMIGGGRNSSGPHKGPSDSSMEIAEATGSVVAELRMVPNQPLEFHKDGKMRTEDDLIAYTWEMYLKTGDPSWPARNAMIKSAIRAMDTVTAVMATPEAGGQRIDKFVVAGASKRGWTTWLTGALDKRVVAIIPIVIDVLNVNVSMKHHFAAYGFWAPAVDDYVSHRIMARMHEPRLEELYHLVDPYYYRHRLTMPKFILNASGDQFFLPDSSQFYYNELEGEKYLRYVANTDHSLKESDAVKSIAAFYSRILTGTPRPRFSWTFEGNDEIRIHAEDKPMSVQLWQATNPKARDFRLENVGKIYTSSKLKSDGNGGYVARVSAPPEGWTAFYCELTFKEKGTLPLKVTTGVRVVPDTLPHEDKDPAEGKIGM